MDKVLEPTLGAKDKEPPDGDVGEDREGREIPNERVPDEVDLTVVLDPAIIVCQPLHMD